MEGRPPRRLKPADDPTWLKDKEHTVTRQTTVDTTGQQSHGIKPARPLRPTPAEWACLLALWRLCDQRACRRARACRRNPVACVRMNYPLLPDGARDWIDEFHEAQSKGLSFEAAMEEIDATDAGDAFRDWYAAVLASLGRKDTLPVRWWTIDRRGR